MTTYYLVRHAHADWMIDENRLLSAQGREESNHIADILQKYPIGAIYSSPFTRAYETILPLSTRLYIPIKIEPNLRERKIGNSAIEDFYKAVEATWRDPLFSFPEGESNYIAQQRGLGFFQRLHNEQIADHIVISTHGNLLALILNYYDASIDYAFWKSLTIPDIYELSSNQNGEMSIRKLWNEK
jgi:2,3-bisphosphoglycerate-dependent phosphoglycerate mutase